MCSLPSKTHHFRFAPQEPGLSEHAKEMWHIDSGLSAMRATGGRHADFRSDYLGCFGAAVRAFACTFSWPVYTLHTTVKVWG